jgi:L-seryl-tRNA(Ser) seleniumtransferase
MDRSNLQVIPPVHRLLSDPRLRDWEGRLGREVVRAHARSLLAELRAAYRKGTQAPTDEPALVDLLIDRLRSDRPGIRPIINATGILIHTGLGRAPLGESVAAHVAAVARGYCTLEFDAEGGGRGDRTAAVAELLRVLTGAEDATVVNNNAAATLLTLRALASGREVVVSRGQLVEIGGSYRLPEVFAASGARLREVGTTNKTRLVDYERAVGLDTAALLRVHTSNYQIVGFAESVAIADLATLARERGLLCIDDIGSGALGPGLPDGVAGEPTFRESLAAGADLVLGSGDKLLGGPQAGIIVGRRDAVRRVVADPLWRACRMDKLNLAALEAILRAARSPVVAARTIPLWSLLACPAGEIERRARRLADRLREQLGQTGTVVSTNAHVGGGSAPEQALPSFAVRLGAPLGRPPRPPSDAARALRLGEPAVAATVREDALWLDLRAVFPHEDEAIIQALGQSLNLVGDTP